MNVPLNTEQQNAVHAQQVRARALGLTLELHFTLGWLVVILLDGREFASSADVEGYLSSLEVAR